MTILPLLLRNLLVGALLGISACTGGAPNIDPQNSDGGVTGEPGPQEEPGPELQAPVIATAPTSTTTSTNATFSFGSSGSAVEYRCNLDSMGFQACTSPKTYSGLAVGMHTFEVLAADAQGLVSAGTRYSWKIEAITPPPPPPPSGIVCDTVTTTAAPPTTWQEHWFEHNQLLSLISYNDGTAVYYDKDVDRLQASFLFDFVCRMRIHVDRAYGSIGAPRLFAIFHTGKYGGGHPDYYYGAAHDYRNVIDQGLDWGWSNTDGQAKDIISHELGHIVESTVHGKKGSPAWDIWKDSKWAEFFQYDMYVALGMTADANRVYNRWITKAEDFPRAGTYWFRDWFYPLWRDYDRSAVMRDFYQLVKLYWPADSGNVRKMNLGEFVHFTSGAAGANLKGLATSAFGWTTTTESEFQAARAAYPLVTSLYPK